MKKIQVLSSDCFSLCGLCAAHMIKILRIPFLEKMCGMPHKKNFIYASSAHSCEHFRTITTQLRTAANSAHNCEHLRTIATQLRTVVSNTHSCRTVAAQCAHSLKINIFYFFFQTFWFLYLIFL